MKKLLKKYSLVLFFVGVFIPHQISNAVEKAVIVLTGQSNMARSASNITALMPGYDVINCSKGGTSVTQWQRGNALYEDCVAKVQGRNVVGIMHFQGERDSYDPVVYSQWSALTLQFFDNFREDIGADGVTVVYAQLGTPPTDRDRPYWQNIQSQQAHLYESDATLRLIRTYTITPYCPATGPHWCSAGYVTIAQKFVSKFLE